MGSKGRKLGVRSAARGDFSESREEKDRFRGNGLAIFGDRM